MPLMYIALLFILGTGMGNKMGARSQWCAQFCAAVLDMAIGCVCPYLI